MRKTRVLVACLSVLALTCSSLAAANDRAGAFSVRLGGGYYFFASKRQMENTGVPNLELGYDFTDNWGIIAGVSVINTRQRPSYGNEQVHGFFYNVDAIHHWQQYGRFEPYALAGIGVVGLKPNAGVDPTNQGNVNAGVGAKYFMTDSIAIGADVRDIYTLSGGKNDVMLTAGVTFLFGGEEKKPETTYKN